MDGYDLDLTYVTTNIIAMSFPSKGKVNEVVYQTAVLNSILGSKAVYRNKIDHVAKFFEEKYSDSSHIDYMIYNLCSERMYDETLFGNNVERLLTHSFHPTLDDSSNLSLPAG